MELESAKCATASKEGSLACLVSHGTYHLMCACQLPAMVMAAMGFTLHICHALWGVCCIGLISYFVRIKYIKHFLAQQP